MQNSSSGRGRGRPVAEIPTMPVFLGAARSRKQMQVVMSGPVARELEMYIDWASGVAMMAEDEVLIRVMDHALLECFRSDKKWQKDKAGFMAEQAQHKGAAPSAPIPPADATGPTGAVGASADRAPRLPGPTSAAPKAS